VSGLLEVIWRPKTAILIFQQIYYFSVLFQFVIFGPLGFVISLVFKLNFHSLRGSFSFNKIIENFHNFGGFRKPLFDRFVACNVSVYLLGLKLVNPCFCSASKSLYSLNVFGWTFVAWLSRFEALWAWKPVIYSFLVDVVRSKCIMVPNKNLCPWFNSYHCFFSSHYNYFFLNNCEFHNGMGMKR